jgi:hypothetical protein
LHRWNRRKTKKKKKKTEKANTVLGTIIITYKERWVTRMVVAKLGWKETRPFKHFLA